MRVLKNTPTRDKYQTIKEILESLPGLQTHIMYKARLQYYRVKFMIYELQEKNFIQKKNDIYYITEQGKKFLDLMNERGYVPD